MRQTDYFHPMAEFNSNNNELKISNSKEVEEYISEIDVHVFLLNSVDAKEYCKKRDGERKDLMDLLIKTKVEKSSLSDSDLNDIKESMNELTDALNNQKNSVPKLLNTESKLSLYIKSVVIYAELFYARDYFLRKLSDEPPTQDDTEELKLGQSSSRESYADTEDLEQNKFTIYFKGSEKSPNDIACLITTPEKKISSADDVICEKILDVNPLPPIPTEYDMIRHLMKVSVSDAVKLKKMKHPWKFTMAHFMRRDSSKEVIAIYLNQEDSWTEVPATEIRNEYGGIKAFNVESMIKAPFPLLLTLVWRPRTEQFQIDKRGIRHFSTLFNGLGFLAPQRAIKIKMTYFLKIRQIETWYVEELKKRHPIEMKGLLSASSIVDISANVVKKANHPLHLSLPIAEQIELAQNVKKTDDKIVDEEEEEVNDDDDSKPKGKSTGYVPLDGFQKLFQPLPFMIGYANDDVFLLTQGDETKWKIWSEGKMTRETNESVAITFEDTSAYKLVVLRTAIGTTNEEAIKMINLIEQDFNLFSVTILLRYAPNTDHQNCVLEVCLTSNLSATIEQLEDMGYTQGSKSQNLVMRDREMIYIESKGNIIMSVKDDQDSFAFNRLLKNRMFFTIKEADKYTQKNLEDFRGYIVMTRDQKVRKRKANTKQIEYEYVNERTDLCQLPIWKPKPKHSTRERHRFTQFIFTCPGENLHTEIIRTLAKRMAPNWIKFALKLGLSETRTETLRRLYLKEDKEELCYHMLTTWIKSKKCSYKKIPALLEALEQIEKFDVHRELSFYCKAK